MKSPNRNQLLAMAWDESSLYFVRARMIGKRIVIDEADAFDNADDAQPDDWPKRVGRKTTILCAIPRSQVEIFDLDLPPASPSELPIFVRNEVSRQVSDLTDECVVDFVVDSDQTAGNCRVTAFALSADRLRELHSRNHSLGINADQLSVRALATASLFRRVVGSSQGRCLLVTPLSKSIDISVFDHGKVMFTRSVRADSEDAESIVSAPVIAELRRTLLVADGDDDKRVEHIYLFGEPTSTDASIAELAEQLELPVSLLDPFEGIEGTRPIQGTHRFAPLIGMIQDYVEGETDIDFLHPRKPSGKASNWRKLAFYATAGAVAMAAILFSLGSDLKTAANELTEMQKEIEKQETILKKLNTKAAVASAIDNWEANEINVLDEFRDISLRFPPSSEAVVRRFSSTVGNGQMSISMEVRAAEPTMFSDLEDLIRAPHRSIQNKRFSQQDGAEPYENSFQSSITIRPRDRAEYREPVGSPKERRGDQS